MGAVRQTDVIARVIADDPTQTARRLFADGAGFALCPDPVLVLSRTGRTLAENRAADGVLQLVGGEPRPVDAVAEACRRGAPVRWEAELSAEAGARIVEITILPLGPDAGLVSLRDITADRSLRNALVESRRRYKDLVEIGSDFAWETDADGAFVFVSPQGALGYSADALIGRGAETLLAVPVSGRDSPFRTTAPITDADLWLTRADGSTAAIVVSALPVFGRNDVWHGARGICRDVSAVWQRDAALARAQTRERLIAYIIRAIRDDSEPNDTLRGAARAVARAFGARGCEILCRDADGRFDRAASFGDCTRPDDGGAILEQSVAASGDSAAVSEDGRHLAVATSIGQKINGALLLERAELADPFGDDDRTLALDVAVQIAIAIEQVESRSQLEALSRTDELTGLLNRRAFRDEVAARMARRTPRGAPAALFYVDVDNFKLVNDTFGHERGDAVLCELSELLRANTRPGDLVARLGGDEFGLWLDRTDAAAAASKAEALIVSAGPLAGSTGDPDRPLGLSVGVAVHGPRSGETLGQLTERADAAMYRIKHGAKGGFVVAPDTPMETRPR